MADLIKKIKIKKQDGTFTDYIPIGAEASNVNTEDGLSVENKLKKKPYYFDTVADMKAATYLKNGDMAITSGYYEINDGGEAEYKIVQSSDIYVENLNNNLKAELIIRGEWNNVLKFGIKNDGTTDISTSLTNALATGLKNIFFPNGTYLLSEKLIIPATCRTIKGEHQRYTTIQCSTDGFEISGSYYVNIDNIRMVGTSSNANTALKGRFCNSNLNNIWIENFQYGIYITGGCWITSFNYGYFSNCSYGIYKDNDGNFNANTIRNCSFGNNQYSIYIASSSQNINIYSDDFESNQHCVSVRGSTSLLNIEDCYCEGNVNIFQIDTRSFTDSSYFMKRCRLYASSTNAAPGWIAIFPTTSSDDTLACPFTISDCFIYFNGTENKPFSFMDTNEGTYTKTYIAINILNNCYKYLNKTNYPYTYFDLIDTTNLPNYMNDTARFAIKTDLIYDRIGTTLLWTLNNKGVDNGFRYIANVYHVFGYYEFTSTGASNYTITIPRHCGAYTTYSKKHTVTIMYTDGTIQECIMNINNTTMVIIGLDTSKTTQMAIFDCTYIGTSAMSPAS